MVLAALILSPEHLPARLSYARHVELSACTDLYYGVSHSMGVEE